jgi:hypothetical protein
VITLDLKKTVNENNTQVGLFEIMNEAPKHDSLDPMIGADENKTR